MRIMEPTASGQVCTQLICDGVSAHLRNFHIVDVTHMHVMSSKRSVSWSVGRPHFYIECIIPICSFCDQSWFVARLKVQHTNVRSVLASDVLSVACHPVLRLAEG